MKKPVRFSGKFVVQNNVDAEIHIITGLKTILTYRSWVLPSVFVNSKPVIRACPTASFRRDYRPSEENIFKNLKQNNPEPSS